MKPSQHGDWMIVAWPDEDGNLESVLECGDAANLDGARLYNREEMEAFIADLRAKADDVWGGTTR